MSRLQLAYVVPVFALIAAFTASRPVPAQTSVAQEKATPLQRVTALHLPRLDGDMVVFYSPSAKAQALRDRAEIGECIAWWKERLHVKVPITLAVLNEADWNKVGDLEAYPMAEAMPGNGDVIFMPDSFAKYPGQNGSGDLGKKLEFISLHEAGHLYAHALHLEGPDGFMQEFYATMLATAYAVKRRPELVTATLNSRAPGAQRPPHTSIEELDLLNMGIGFDSYDWLQVETVRLAVFFVKDQTLRSLVDKLLAAFPPGQVLLTHAVLKKMDAIQPGFLASVGNLARPASLPVLAPVPCIADPLKEETSSVVGILNTSGHSIPTVEDGARYELPPGYSQQFGKVGAQFRLPSGDCITYPKAPAYIELH